MEFSTLRISHRGREITYLDHNATTPLSERVAACVPEWLSMWGNPSSIHQSGRGPKTLMRDSRDKIAKMIGANPLEIIFTSGGSEANNFALKGVFEGYQKPTLIPRKFRSRYLVSSVEHPSVHRTAEILRERGAEVDFIPVRRDGSVDLEAYAAMVDESTALVSFMLANNETGSIFPIKRMVEIAHAKGAYFHSDCVQALGKMQVDVRDLGVDLATFSGHKFYSLRGSGFLYARKGVVLESLIHGGGQERHRRGGTENVLAIASLGKMAELSGEIGVRAVEIERLRDHLERRIQDEIHGVRVTGAESPRLPNTSSLLIEAVDGETLLMNLDMRGFSVSTGAACSSGSAEPSPVLLAMGLSRSEAQSSLRLGLGWGTTLSEIDTFCDTLKDVVRHIRSFSAGDDHLSDKDSHVGF